MELKEITTHKINEVNDGIDLYRVPENMYTARYYRKGDKSRFEKSFVFQNGTLPEVGNNGITVEVLLAIVKDRLEMYQNGKFACRENALALTKIDEALHWLHHRTKDRVKRGVEGKHEL